jgi:hypothetical protein
MGHERQLELWFRLQPTDRLVPLRRRLGPRLLVAYRLDPFSLGSTHDLRDAPAAELIPNRVTAPVSRRLILEVVNAPQ